MDVNCYHRENFRCEWNTMNRWVIRACALISVLSLLSGQSEYPGYMFWLSSVMILVWLQTEWSDYKKKNRS